MSTFKCEVVEVKDIKPLPGKDRIELIYVLGWQVIHTKGILNVGDKVVYVPVDSLIPEKLAEKLGITGYLKKGERLKSIKLGGYLSQGLLLQARPKDKLGDDVASDFGITKWEPPAPGFMQITRKSGPWNVNPDFHKYTDIENINNYTSIFEEDEEVVIREKIHGTNGRYAKLEYTPKTLWEKVKNWYRLKIQKGEKEILYVGSRGTQITNGNPKTKKSYYQAQGMDKNVYEVIAERYQLDRILPPNYALYGEIYGEGIQDLTYGIHGFDAVFFDLKIDGEYVPDYVMEQFCLTNGLHVAPLLYRGPYSLDVVKQHTGGKSILAPDQIREGCVVKSVNESFHPQAGRKILKSISEDYYLRKDGTEFH
jgi:RNA ligase (TIGR02306 family)